MFVNGDWVLGQESLFRSIGKTRDAALGQLNRVREKQGFLPVKWGDFLEVFHELCNWDFPGQTQQEGAIVRQINSEFFRLPFARRWGLKQLLDQLDNVTLHSEVCATAWFEGNDIPLLLRDFSKVDANEKKRSEELEEDKPESLSVTDILILHVEQKIRDKLDCNVQAVPSHCDVFVRYCRDRLTLKDMSRKHKWNYSTLKNRKAAIECFLQKKFGLTLSSFFVDRSIFSVAEKQLKEDYGARQISLRRFAEFGTDQDDD